jgi:predicted ATPase
MAPMTLFFGANSAGKSNIGKFLMMLKQTVLSPDRKTVFYPGVKGSAVQLSSYLGMAFCRNPDNKNSFECEWNFEDIPKAKDPVSGQSFSGGTLSFGAEVGLG